MSHPLMQGRSVLAYLPHARRILRKSGLPLQLVYFVTSRCNALCRHCFYWSRLNSGVRELSLEEVDKTASTLPSLLWLSLTGGEPFLRRDLAEVAEIFQRRSRFRVLTIPSNGFLTDRVLEGTQRILEACPNALVIVSVSLDGLQQTHDRIRGVPNGFEKARRTFDGLRKLKRRYANFSPVVTITCSPLNQTELTELYRHVRDDWEPDNIGIGLLRGESPGTSRQGLDIGYYRRVNRMYERDLRSGKIRYYDTPVSRLLGARELQVREMVARIFEENRYLTPCYAASLSAVMLETGEVRPCELLDASMGNLRDHDFDFRKLWESAQAQQVRSSVRGCFCTHECVLNSNVLFNPKRYPSLLRKMWRMAV